MHTRSALARDLGEARVPQGGVLVLHSGYRSLGAVEGGPTTVVGALLDVIGPRGTLMAPTFTDRVTDPYLWAIDRTPEERDRIRASLEDFDPARTAPQKMGAVATAVWRWPGALRSTHPVTSWAAIGPRADELLRDQPLDDPEGIDGPVGRAYRADARILLLGVDHDANTTIHVAESLLDMPHLYELPDRFPTRDASGNRLWRPVAKTTKCSDGFVALRPHLAAAGAIRTGRVGHADTQLLRSRDVVRVALDVLSADPTALLCPDPECVHCPTSRRVLTGWRPAGRPELPL